MRRSYRGVSGERGRARLFRNRRVFARGDGLRTGECRRIKTLLDKWVWRMHARRIHELLCNRILEKRGFPVENAEHNDAHIREAKNELDARGMSRNSARKAGRNEC